MALILYFLLKPNEKLACRPDTSQYNSLAICQWTFLNKINLVDRHILRLSKCGMFGQDVSNHLFTKCQSHRPCGGWRIPIFKHFSEGINQTTEIFFFKFHL